MRPKIELTRIPVVYVTQIEHNGDASARTNAVLHRLAIMAQNPEQPYQIPLEVREARCVGGRGASTTPRNAILAVRGRRLDLPNVDSGKKTVEQAECL